MPRDVLAVSLLRLTDNARRQRNAVRKSAEFLGWSVEDTVRIAASGKKAFYDEWNRLAGGQLDDCETQRLYLTLDFYVARLPWSRRNQTWFNLLRHLPKNGTRLEYGCGAAVLTEWVIGTGRMSGQPWWMFRDELGISSTGGSVVG